MILVPALLAALIWITALVARKQTPRRLVAACALGGAAFGAVFGFVRGLDHMPTLVFAIIEGAILFGVPAWLLGLLLAGGWWIGISVRHRPAH